MPNEKQKLVMVPGTGVVAFPGDMEDEHVAAAIRAFRSQKAADEAAKSHPLNRPQPLMTEQSERQRQAKQAQPLSTAIPHLPAWLNTPSTELGRQTGNWLSGEIGKALGTTLPEIDLSARSEQEAEQFRQAHPVAGGVAHGISDIANSLTSPAGAALLLTAPESKLMSAFFATQALHGAYRDAQAARQAYMQGNNEEATRYATESILGGAMGLAAGAHAVRPELGPQGEVLPPEAKPGPEFPALGSPTPVTLEGKTGGFALPEYDEAPIANYQLIYKSPSATPEEMNAAVQDLVKARQAPGWNDPNATDEEARQAQQDFYAAADRLGKLRQQSVGQIRQIPSGEKIVYLTQSGLNDLSAGLRGRAPDPEYSLNGVSIAGRYIPIVQANLAALKTPHSEELTKLLSMGAGPDGTVTVSAIPNKNETLSNALSRLREELNHGWQKQFSDQMGNHLPSTQFRELNGSIPEAMSDYLGRHGYNVDDGSRESNRMRVLEASAKMMSGAPSEFGLTPDQAANYLFQYFDAVTRQHGPQALDQLVHTTNLARNIKRDYANARYPSRGSQNQGTVSGLPAGGQGRAQESIGAPGRGTAPVTGPPAQAGAAAPSVEASRAAIERTPDDARRRLQQARESYSALDPESVRRYEEALRDYVLSTRVGMNQYLQDQIGQIRTAGDVSDIDELERMRGLASPEEVAAAIDWANPPRAASTVDGLEVTSHIPNQSSIDSALDSPTVLPGIREIPLDKEWYAEPKDTFKSASDIARTHKLAEEIRNSGRIDPLIVAVEYGKPYILEGVHRLSALHLLGKKAFPAMVVLEGVPEMNQTRRTPESSPSTLSDLMEEAKRRAPGATWSEPFSPGVPTKDTTSKPGYIYHATNLERAEEIAGQGLRTHKPWEHTDQSSWPDGSTKKRSYFSPNAGVVWQFAPEEGKPVILRVKQDARFKRESTGDIYTNEKIPASDLEILDSSGKWVPIKQAFPPSADITMNQTRREKEPLPSYEDLLSARGGTARSIVAPHTRSDEEFLRSQFVKPPKTVKAQRELADKIGRERYEIAAAQFDALPETFTVYRAIEPAEGTEVDRANLGRYWTTEQSAAKPYHGPSRGTKAGVVLRGTVRKDQVDAKQTIIARMRTGEAALEKEINLRAGETPSDVSVVSPEAPDVTMNQVRATKETAKPKVQDLMDEALRRRPTQPTLSEVRKDIAARAPSVVP